MLCSHCRKGPVSRPRGLCWTCYYKPEVRHQYKSRQRKFGIGANTKRALLLPSDPTDAPPGSEEKIRILCKRAAANVQLWHPDDVKLE